MATVQIPSSLKSLTDRSALEIPATDVRQLLQQLQAEYPELGKRLTDANGLRPGLAVAVDGAMIGRDLLHPLTATSEVRFVPALSGG